MSKDYCCPLCSKVMVLHSKTEAGNYYECKDCRFVINVTAYGDRAPSYSELIHECDEPEGLN